MQHASSRSHKRTDSSDNASSVSSEYFSRFSENGTPFDVNGELDSSFVEEDIMLAGVSILWQSLLGF